jgi:serine/threonine protein kinase
MSGLPSRLASALADRYRIERLIGEGGMASVYLAQDLEHNRQDAIKALKPELAAGLLRERLAVVQGIDDKVRQAVAGRLET